MKHLIIVLVIYVLIQKNGETITATWDDGQPVAQLMQERMANDKSITGYRIVTKQEYDSVVVPLPTNEIDPKKVKLKKDLNTKTKTDTERLEALIQYLDLAE